MLAGEIYAPRKIRLVDVPAPQLGAAGRAGREAGEILFQVELACLCGSDIVFFETDYPEYPPERGHSLHEMIGVVVDTDGDRFRPGDRVLCVPENQQGLFERFRVSQQRAIPLDPRPPREQALLAQPLGTVLSALRKTPSVIDRTVIVVGQGPIGQLFCAALRNLGARRIIAVDRLASRLATSPRMGATAVVDASQQDPIDAVRQITGGDLGDLVVEAVGHRDQALNRCIDLCRPFGSILYFGLPTTTIDGVRWLDLMRKNITIITSLNPEFDTDFPLAMRWIAEGRVDVAPIITHRFPLEKIQQAFDTFHQRRDGALKVLVDFPAAAQESQT